MRYTTSQSTKITRANSTSRPIRWPPERLSPSHFPNIRSASSPCRNTNQKEKPIDLTATTGAGKLTWTAPSSAKSYTVYVTATQPDYLLHPDNGKELVEVYFDRFEQNMNQKGRDGMNYFFQDELLYPLTILSWAEDMPAQFRERKGYDILPYLAA